MPNAAVLFGQNLTTGGPYPYLITVNGLDVTQKAELRVLEYQDTGDEETGRLKARLWDPTSALAVPELGVIRVWEESTDSQLWMGFVQKRTYDANAVGRWINLEGISISSYLDEIAVPYENRPAESDRARVLYLWGKYGRAPLSGDPAFVTQTASSIEAAEIANMSLRSALISTAGLANAATVFYVDGVGRLHWFAPTESNPAPFNINVASPPGGGNIAPADLEIDRDATIKNAVYVRGATPAATLYVQDDASVAQYGRFEAFLDAPEATTATQARAMAARFFARNAQPRTRGSFSTQSPNDGWAGGQNVTVTDPRNDLSAQSFRIVRTTTKFLTGVPKKTYVVEFGRVRPSSSSRRFPDLEALLGSKSFTGGRVAGDIGGPSKQGVTVSDLNGNERVRLGQISATPDHGIKVTSADGSTVVIDGTSNMFKIQATGTMTRAFPAAGNSASTSVTVSGTGSSLLAFLNELTHDNSGSGNARVVDGMNSIGLGTGTASFGAQGSVDVNTGDNRVTLGVASYLSNPGTTAGQRYYLLKEAGI